MTLILFIIIANALAPLALQLQHDNSARRQCAPANMHDNASTKSPEPEPWPAVKDEEMGTVEVRPADGTHNLIAAQDQLKRGLKSRHIQFLALGGAYVFCLLVHTA